MNRLLFTLLLFASYNGFCGCANDYGLFINGKLIDCFCPWGPYTSSINTNYASIDSPNYRASFFRDTLYLNPGDSTIIQAPFWHLGSSMFTDTNSSFNINSLVVKKAGFYDFQFCREGCACTFEFRFTLVFKTPNAINTIPAALSYITISPNPVQSTINLHSENKIQAIHIYDQLGRLQLQPDIKSSSANYYQSNIEILAKGVYTIEAILENGTREIRKIVKE